MYFMLFIPLNSLIMLYAILSVHSGSFKLIMQSEFSRMNKYLQRTVFFRIKSDICGCAHKIRHIMVSVIIIQNL